MDFCKECKDYSDSLKPKKEEEVDRSESKVCQQLCHLEGLIRDILEKMPEVKEDGIEKTESKSSSLAGCDCSLWEGDEEPKYLSDKREELLETYID